MNKLSSRCKYIKLSSRDHSAIVQEMKEKIKQDPDVQEKFKKYKVHIDEIDNVHVEFCDLPVSAKTKNQKIYLNEAMLDDDSDIDDPSHYLAHEMIHFLQQSTGNVAGHKSVDEYLDKPTEMEAFQTQIDYKERHEGEGEAATYVEDLLDHHDYSGSDRKEKKEELTQD